MVLFSTVLKCEPKKGFQYPSWLSCPCFVRVVRRTVTQGPLRPAPLRCLHCGVSKLLISRLSGCAYKGCFGCPGGAGKHHKQKPPASGNPVCRFVGKQPLPDSSPNTHACVCMISVRSSRSLGNVCMWSVNCPSLQGVNVNPVNYVSSDCKQVEIR